MKFFNTIKKRLLFWACLACTITYSVCGIYVTHTVEKWIRDDFDKLAQEHAAHVQDKINEQIVASAKAVAAMLARDERTEVLMQRLGGDVYDHMPGKMTDQELQHFFLFLETHKDVLGVAIATEVGGYLPYTYVPMTDRYDPRVRPWYTAAMATPGKPVVSDPYMQLGNRMVLPISHTVGPLEKPTGVIVWGWSLDTLANELNAKQIGHTGHVMLLNENNKIIVSPKYPAWLLKTPDNVNLFGLDDLATAHGQIRHLTIEGIDKLVYIDVHPQTGWKVLCLIDEAEVVSAVQHVLLPIWLAFGLSIVVVCGLLLWLANDISRPLTRLATYAQTVAGGGFPDVAPSNRTDEFGILSRSFTHMVNELAAAAQEQQQSRKALEEKELQFRLLAENAADVIFLYRIKPEYRMEYISPAILPLAGYNPNELYKEPTLFFAIVNQTTIESQVTDLSRWGIASSEYRLVSRDGNKIWVEQKCVAVVDNSGAIVAIEGIIRDVSERKKMEDEFSRFDRLNVVGQMAANIAHEVRNPLTVIRGYLQHIGGKADFTKYREQFLMMVSELDRANQIITEYLSLSKHGFVDFKTGNLNQIIEAISPLLQVEATSNEKYLRLELRTIADLCLDEKQIRQLLLNLVRNGLEASPRGGTVTIQTYMSNDHVVLAVQDQGPGIPVDILEKLGTPFVTTKEYGTGIGLPVCYRIADSHHGTIHVRTSSEGSKFSVHFRLHEKEELNQ